MVGLHIVINIVSRAMAEAVSRRPHYWGSVSIPGQCV